MHAYIHTYIYIRIRKEEKTDTDREREREQLRTVGLLPTLDLQILRMSAL